MKVLFVLGTRPEAVKLFTVIREAAEYTSGRAEVIKPVVCVTAQHRDMLDQMLRVFEIRPDYDLDTMTPNQSPTQVAALVMKTLEPVLSAENPDWVVVQGDTTTAAAAALAAFYGRCRVAHVEAGLRSGDRWQPFPEEINRRVAGVIADLHFAPTIQARANLIREGIPESSVIVTGNTVVDALHAIASRPPTPEVVSLLSQLCVSGRPEADGKGRRVLLVTAHRRENLGEPLKAICLALREIAERYSDSVTIVYPVHRNPRVSVVVHKLLGSVPNIVLTDPLDYVTLTHLLKACYFVLTDSGGIQEEAPVFNKPVLVLRETTERPEGVAAGVARLLGTRREEIVAAATNLLEHEQDYHAMTGAVNLYGDGTASRRIIGALLSYPKSFGTDSERTDSVGVCTAQP